MPRRGPPRPPPIDEKTLQHTEAAIRLIQGLEANSADDPAVRLLLARAYRQRAWQAARDEGSWGTEDWNKAVELLEELVREHPTVADYRFELSQAYGEPDFRALLVDVPTATKRLAQALTLSEGLVRQYPRNPAYAAAQVRVRHRLSLMLARTDRKDEASAQLRQALELQAALTSRYPDNPAYIGEHALMTMFLAMLLVEDDRAAEAIELLESSTTSLSAREMDSSLPHFAAGAVGGLYDFLGRLRERQRDPAGAREAFETARKYSDRPMQPPRFVLGPPEGDAPRPPRGE